MSQCMQEYHIVSGDIQKSIANVTNSLLLRLESTKKSLCPMTRTIHEYSSDQRVIS